MCDPRVRPLVKVRGSSQVGFAGLSLTALLLAAESADQTSMIEQTLAALFVICLLFAAVWILRRKGVAVSNGMWKRPRRNNQLQLIERLPLTAQHSIHLVRVGNELIVVGVSPGSCSAIASADSILERQVEAAL